MRGRAGEASARVAADAVVLPVPIEVVDYEQVQQAVTVVVRPRSRDSPLRTFGLGCRQTGAGRNVLKTTAAHVAVQRVDVHAGHEYVRPTVVVVVARRDAHAVTDPGHAGVGCDVLERSGARVSVEAVVERLVALDQVRESCTVGEEYVQQPVSVAVQHGHSAQGGVWHRLVVGRAVVQDEVDPVRCRGEAHYGFRFRRRRLGRSILTQQEPARSAKREGGGDQPIDCGATALAWAWARLNSSPLTVLGRPANALSLAHTERPDKGGLLAGNQCRLCRPRVAAIAPLSSDAPQFITAHATQGRV